MRGSVEGEERVRGAGEERRARTSLQLYLMGPMPSWRAMSLSFWPGMAWEDLTSPLGSRHVIVRIVFVATPFFSSESSLANAAARPSNMPMRTSLCRQARHPKPGLGGVSSAAAPTVRRCKTMQTRRNSCMRRFDDMSKQDTKGEENGRDWARGASVRGKPNN